MSELRIAKGFLRELKIYSKPDIRWYLVYGTCNQHQLTCQRWLKFIIRNRLYNADVAQIKIKDLKETIKLYEEKI